MPMDQLPRFLAALRRHESNNRYEHVAEDGKRVGAYGFSPENWKRWSAQVGLDGAPWQSQAAQDMVAREKARELYNRYGDWQLVAVAWWGGTAYADSIAAEGALPPDAEFADDALRLTKGLRPGRTKVNGEASQSPQQPPERAGSETQLTTALKKAGTLPRAEVNVAGSEMHRMMAPILQGLSNSIRTAPDEEAPRDEGIPSGSPGSTTAPAPGSTTGSGGEY